MPPLPPTAGITQAVMGFSYNGQNCANVLHFSNADGTGSPDETELGDRLKAWWVARLQAQMPTTLTLRDIILRPLDPDAPVPSIYTTGLPLNGLNAGQQLPNNCTACISLKTALRGRSFRGRIYHVGLVEAHVDLNTITSAFRAILLTAYDDLISLAGDVGEPNYNLNVLSYISGGVLRPLGLATPVAAVSIDTVVDSQRRRLPGRGS